MKKILYIITQSDWGGAQKYIFDLATNLYKSQEYNVIVAAGGSGELFGLLEAKNLPVARLKYLTRVIRPLYDLLAYFEIKKLIKTVKPDIVHLNSSKAGAIGALAARRLGVPKIIYTAHGFVFNEPLSPFKKWLYKKIELFSSKRIDKIIAVSEYDRQAATGAGIAPNKLITIHNGIDFAAMNFRPRDETRNFLRQRIRAATDQFFNFSTNQLIVTIANFYTTKGLNVLIRAMTRVDAKLIIIGDGLLRSNLENLIRELRLDDKIFLTGYLGNAGQYLKAFDLFVLPSRKEGLPYTLLEVAAAGVPIVATSVGGVPEIIQDGVNGYLARAHDVKALADAINRGLVNPLPPRISGFNLEAMLQKTKTVYES